MQSIKVLFVEDNKHDVELLVRHLSNSGIEVNYDIVDSLKELEKLLNNNTYDICICDFGFPEFNGLDALEVVNKTGIDLPVILVSGSILDEQAIEAVLAGAKDYVLKDNLTRLVPAVNRELEALANRKEKAETDRLLQAVFDSPSGVRITDEDRIIIKVNEAYCKMMGYTESELLGQSIDLVIPKFRIENDRKEYRDFIADKKNSELISKGKFKLDIRKDGGYIDVYIKSKVIDGIDNKKFVVSNLQDVSEFFKYKTLFEESGRIAKLGGWEFNIAKGKEVWTEQVYQIFGVTSDTFNPSVDDFRKFYTPEYFSKADKAMKEAANGKPFDIELQLKDANGVLKWCRATGNPIYENDKVVKIIGSIQDISDSKQRELEIYESQRNYRYLFEMSPNPMLIFEEESQTVLFSNAASENLYGFSKIEFLGLKPESIYQHYNEYEQSWSSKEKNDGSINSVFNVKHLTKDGKQIIVNIYSRKIIINGKSASIFVINDVTEKHKYEQELIRTNNLLKELIKKAPIGIITVDKLGRVDDIWNPEAEQIFGWSREEVLGKILPYVPSAKNDEFRYNLKQGAEERRSFITELERVRKNGKAVHLKEFVVPIIDEQDEVSKVMMLVEDITKEKQVENALISSEEKYRNLVEASHDIIWRMDTNGVLTFMNNACEAILGYTSEELVNTSFKEYINPEKLDETIDIHNRVKSGESIENFPLKMITKDGEDRYLIGTAYPIRNKNGEIFGASGTATDITNIKNYQNELEKSLEEKEILIREIHHRVKNNLAVISGLFALQAMRIEDESVLSILKESQSRIKSIATIHEKLYQNDLFSSIHMKDYFQELINEIAGTYSRRDRDITTEIIGDNITLNVNQAVPFGILANELIINAYKYAFSVKEKGTISLILNKENDKFIFTLKDNGEGLPEDFDIDNLDSLGMTLVKTLVAQLNAKFSWDSKSGEGVAFTVEFKPEYENKSSWIKK